MARIVLLVGPKGVGKTTLGTHLARREGWTFVDAEPLARGLLERFASVSDPRYAEAVMEAVLDEVRDRACRARCVVTETTGASAASVRLRDGLQAPLLVRLSADSATCGRRMLARDASAQLEVPAALVAAMYDASSSLAWRWDLELDATASVPALASAVWARVETPGSRPG